VRNTGGTMSEPVTAVLNLPPGVSAVPVDGLAGRRLLSLNGPKAATVNCPGGAGTVTCTSDVGLAPNETVTLLFRLVAAGTAMSGQITGIASAGTNVTVNFALPVNVRPAPVTDAVKLEARGSWSGLLLWIHPIVDVTVTNTGTSSLPVTLTVDQPADVVTSTQMMTCTVAGGTTCVTAAELAPGEKLQVTLQIDADSWPELSPNRKEVHISATLGSATDSENVTLWDCFWPTSPVPPTPPGGSPPPVTPPSTTTPPPGTSTKPTEPTHPSPPVATTTGPTTTTTTKPSDPGNGDPGRDDHSPAPTTEPPTTSDPPSGGLGGLLGWLLGG